MADICVRTAANGGDATGVFDDDAIWSEVYALPYVVRYPEFAFVVETDDGRVAGYIVCAPDTGEFERWFHDEWWPTRGYARPDAEHTRQEATLLEAYRRGTGAPQFAVHHPAHLHIDLLPELQGQGWGRQLIDTLADALRAAGAPGVHLWVSAENTGAIAFYSRVGFTPLAQGETALALGKTL